MGEEVGDTWLGMNGLVRHAAWPCVSGPEVSSAWETFVVEAR